MGAGGDILLSLKTLRSLTLLSLLALSGCLDFVEPDLAEAGAPAVLQTNIYIDENGRLQAGATLVPSLTVDGLGRTIRDDTLRISGLELVPIARKRNGTLQYALTTTLTDPAAFMRPLSVQSPVVSGVSAPPTSVQWFALQRGDPDTVVMNRDQELVLHLLVEPGLSQPEPGQRFWNLELVSDSGRFAINSPGQPPASLRVPDYWIPRSGDGRITAYLTYTLNGTYRPVPGDYIHIMVANLRIRWNIRLAR